MPEQHQRHRRRHQAQPPQQHAEQQHAERGQGAQRVDSGDDEERAAAGVPDEHAERDRDQRREHDGHGRVRQVLEDPGGEARGTAPVGRGEDVGQRLLQEVHAGAAALLRRGVRVARTHGVIAQPSAMISVSMTIASTKIAMMPATIWSLLSAW